MTDVRADDVAAPAHRARSTPPRDWAAIRTIVRKDVTAVRRSKSITIPMRFSSEARACTRTRQLWPCSRSHFPP